MGVFREDDLIEGLGCCTNRLHDDRMPVTMRNHPPGGDRIENRMAMFVDEIGAVCFDDPGGYGIECVLSKGVPDGGRRMRTHHPITSRKNEVSKFLRNAWRRVSGVNGSSRGSLP